MKTILAKFRNLVFLVSECISRILNEDFIVLLYYETLTDFYRHKQHFIHVTTNSDFRTVAS